MRRVGLRLARLTLVVLLAGLVFLATEPFHLAAIRVRGVSLLWWYGGALAPLCAALITLAALPHSRRPAGGCG